MYLFWVLLSGVILRLAYILKPEGLWNDEYVSWMIAATPFKDGFITEIFKQCHMPLYYFYLKIFSIIGNNNDIILRLSSVLPSVGAVWVMYLAGKTRDNFTAKTLAAITAFSAFLVYYSQEVRFYSLLFFFSSLILLFLLKIRINPNKINLAGFVISSLLVLFTHTIGFVFVFFSIVYLISVIKPKRVYYYIFAALFMLPAPFVIYIFLHTGHSQWWGAFSYRTIIFMFTDFFSPILTNNVNIPSVILYQNGAVFAAALIIPALIAVGFIIYSFTKDKSIRGLFYIALFTTITLSAAAITSRFVFITKYNIEILPVLMYLFAVGLSNVKKPIKYSFLLLYLFFQIFYIFMPGYPSKCPRTEGNRIPALLIAKSGIKPEDKLILTYYNPERFTKYINLSGLNITSIDKTEVSRYISDSRKINPSIYLIDRSFAEKKLDKLLIPKQQTFILFLDSVAFFPDKELEKIAARQEYIDMVNPIYLEMSVLRNEILKYGKKHNLVVQSTKMGSWSLIKLGRSTEE